MLKYLLTLYIVSFCDSVPSGHIDVYNRLVLIQSWPVTKYNWLNKYERNRQSFAQYTREQRLVLEPHKWSLHGLWPAHNAEFVTYCSTALGAIPSYASKVLDGNLKKELRTKWPVLKPRSVEDQLWRLEYHERGTCISNDPSFYFESAIKLLDGYNVGDILDNAGIYPGFSYKVDRIEAALRDHLHVVPFFKCTPAEYSEDQYLIEAHMCFNPLHNLTECLPEYFNEDYEEVQQCVSNKNVTYE